MNDKKRWSKPAICRFAGDQLWAYLGYTDANKGQGGR